MKPRHIFILAVVILAAAIGGYVYLHSRAAAPLQDASPDARTTSLIAHCESGEYA